MPNPAPKEGPPVHFKNFCWENFEKMAKNGENGEKAENGDSLFETSNYSFIGPKVVPNLFDTPPKMYQKKSMAISFRKWCK